jgi:hypothetical protein
LDIQGVQGDFLLHIPPSGGDLTLAEDICNLCGVLRRKDANKYVS